MAGRASRIENRRTSLWRYGLQATATAVVGDDAGESPWNTRRWAAFGELINALEISPDGQSVRVNYPLRRVQEPPRAAEPLPPACGRVDRSHAGTAVAGDRVGGEAEVLAAPKSDAKSAVQDELVAHYERVRAGGVDPREDNVLKIVTDGRKLALDAGQTSSPGAELGFAWDG